MLGVIRVHQKLRGMAFLTYDEKLLKTVCDVLAPAILRWNTTAEKEREIALQQRLLTITEALHGNDDPDRILEIIVTQARDLLRGYSCSVFLKEPNEEQLRCRKAVGYAPHLVERLVLDYGQGLCGCAARDGQTIVAPDVRKDNRYVQTLLEVRSEICTAIQWDHQCLGVLNVDSDKPGFFRPRQARTARILEIFAKQAAVALHRAAVLAERKQWQDHLVAATQIHVAGSIASALAHELKNGLTAISTLVQKLDPRPTDERQRRANREKIRRILERTEDLHALAIRLMDRSRVGAADKQEVYLNDIIDDNVKFLEELVKSRNHKLVVRTDPELSRPASGSGHPLRLDRRQIGQALTNLVLNAIDASPTDKPVEVSTKNSREWAAFSVRDFGTGIPPANKKHLFKMFFTTKPHGFGVGLAVVKILVEDNHQGAIKVETQEGKGTTFTVRLPRLLQGEKGGRSS